MIMKTDTHYHIDIANRPKEILESAQENQIRLIAPSLNPESYLKIQQLQKSYSSIWKIGVGLHPEMEHSEAEVHRALELAGTADIIGEVGLPSYNRVPRVEDVNLFRAFCRISAASGAPLIVHAVHTQASPALHILLDEGVRYAAFHWLKADTATVKSIVNAGYLISITPEVTYRQRDQHLLENIPLSNLLVETDGPYEHAGPYKGRETTPLMIHETAAYVAAVHKLSLEAFWSDHERRVEQFFRRH